MANHPGDMFDKPVEVKTDLCAGRHGGAETSSEAYATTTKGARAAQGLKVFLFIEGRPHGATCDEAEAVLGLSHQTCSARITELQAKQKIRFGAEQRKTRAGRNVRVYFAI